MDNNILWLLIAYLYTHWDDENNTWKTEQIRGKTMEDGSSIINLSDEEYERIFGKISQRVHDYFQGRVSDEEHPVITNAQKFEEVFGYDPTGFLFYDSWWKTPYEEKKK